MLVIPILLSVIVAITDLRSRKIYNYIPVLLLVSGVIHTLYFGSIEALVSSLALCAIVWIVLFPFWMKGGIRGGDVKYLVSLSSWMHYDQLIWTVLLGCFMGLMAAFAYLYANGRLRFYLGEMVYRLSVEPKQFLKVDQKSIRIPFGACLAVAAIVIMLYEVVLR